MLYSHGTFGVALRKLAGQAREPFIDTQLKEDTSQLLWKGGGVQERVIPCGLGGQDR